MRYLILQITLALLLLSAAACGTSDRGPASGPSTALFSLRLDGIDEQLAVQQDSLNIASVRLILEDLRMAYQSGQPLVILEGQTGVTYTGDDNGSNLTLASGDIPGAIYRAIGFTLALPENPDTPNPEYSVFITGTYNGSDLQFGTGLTFEHDINLAQGLEVPPENASVDLVIVSDVRDWFTDQDGTIIDPGTQDGKDTIDMNIRSSFDIEAGVTTKDM